MTDNSRVVLFLDPSYTQTVANSRICSGSSVALRVGSTDSESDVKLAQSCQSAPPQLIRGTTEHSSTRDVGQQTSETQLMMPTAAVTETVWTLSVPDTTTEHPHPQATADDGESASSVESRTHCIEPETTSKDESQSLDKLPTKVDLSRSMTAASADVQRGKVTFAKDQTDNADTFVVLNKRQPADMYEDWSTSVAAETKVCTTLTAH